MEHNERSRLILAAAERAAAYVDDAARPVFPSPDAVAALEAFDVPFPDSPSDPLAVLALLDRVGSPAAVGSTHGRYFGFVNGGTDPAAAGAAVLAGAWDNNVALAVMSPVAARLDAVAAGWVVDALGLPANAVASFCGGATVANLTGAIAGRDALLGRLGWDVGARGLAGAPPLRVVASGEVHVSMLKALRMAGIGRDAITFVPTDSCGRIDPQSFPKVDAQTLVLLQAGNVNTGHSDPFAELIPRAHDGGGWVHVDGAFGLWAAASPARRALVSGVEGADSWATDAHKWLNAPYDSGIAICADGAHLRQSFAIDAAYLPADAERAPMHLGVQMSQRARGVETWAVLASRGRAGLAALIDQTCDHAALLAGLLAEAGAEVLAPVVLNQALVAFGSDTVTDAVIAAVQAEGTCWVGGTTWQGRRAMRLSVSDIATTADDIAVSAKAILRCWGALRSG